MPLTPKEIFKATSPVFFIFNISSFVSPNSSLAVMLLGSTLNSFFCFVTKILSPPGEPAGDGCSVSLGQGLPWHILLQQ